MKRFFMIIFAFLLILLPIGLFAQTGRDPAYTILITPMTAEPALEGDITTIYQSLLSELSWQGQVNSLYALVETQRQLGSPPSMSDFSAAEQQLNPRYVVAPNLYQDGPDRVITLNLYNTETFELTGNQELAYTTIDDALGMMAFFCWSLSSTLPPDERVIEPEIVYVSPEDDITWKNKWLYLGLQVGDSFRWYKATGGHAVINNIANTFDAGLRLEFQFFHFMVNNNFFSFSLESGADISQEQLKWTSIRTNNDLVEPYDVSDSDSSGFSLLLPALLRFNYKPGNFSTSLFGGGYYILPFDDSKYDPPFGIMAGFSAGTRLGPGLLYIDFHYGYDLGSKSFNYEVIINGDMTNPTPQQAEYNRQMFTLVAGYKFGFLDRPDWRKNRE